MQQCPRMCRSCATAGTHASNTCEEALACLCTSNHNEAVALPFKAKSRGYWMCTSPLLWSSFGARARKRKPPVATWIFYVQVGEIKAPGGWCIAVCGLCAWVCRLGASCYTVFHLHIIACVNKGLFWNAQEGCQAALRMPELRRG